MPHLDLSWAITTVIAITAFLSPIVVALINNHHAAKMKQMEFVHEENLKQMEQSRQMAEKQFEIYYADKKSAFTEFIQAAGDYSTGKEYRNTYSRLHSATNKVLLFCNEKNQDLMLNFLNKVDKSSFGKGCTSEELQSFSQTLTCIARSLNDELSSNKPVTNSIQSK